MQNLATVLVTIPDKGFPRKVNYRSVSHEYTGSNPKQNIDKLNPATQKKDNVMINLAFFYKCKISLTLKKKVKELERNKSNM